MLLLLLFGTYLAHKRKPGREGGERGREAAWFLNALEASGRQACGGRGGARQLRLPLLVGFRSEGTKAPGPGQREPEGAARGGGRGPTTAAAPPQPRGRLRSRGPGPAVCAPSGRAGPRAGGVPAPGPPRVRCSNFGRERASAMGAGPGPGPGPAVRCPCSALPAPPAFGLRAPPGESVDKILRIK